MQSGKLLFSVDLEDVRDWVEDGQRYRERVPANTERYLGFLQDHNARGTFFVVGDVARRYPSLIREIAGAGHELACHTDSHIQLDRQTPRSLRDDLERNLDALYGAGAGTVTGFRAPTFSLTSSSVWVYPLLRELGMGYSSSVLPAANPLYGWPGFGQAPRRMEGGVWELPITLHRLPVLQVPVAGGVYFRVLPWWLIRFSAGSRARQGLPLLTYLHPYDIDEQQERFMHPDIGRNRFYNWLMYRNRDRVLARLQRLVQSFGLCSYQEYVQEQLA